MISQKSRKKKKKRERDRERDRQTETERQTDRDREREREAYIQTYRKTNKTYSQVAVKMTHFPIGSSICTEIWVAGFVFINTCTSVYLRIVLTKQTTVNT